MGMNAREQPIAGSATEMATSRLLRSGQHGDAADGRLFQTEEPQASVDIWTTDGCHFWFFRHMWAGLRKR